MNRLQVCCLTLCLLAGLAAAETPRPPRKGKAVAVTVRSIPDGALLYLDDKAYGLVAYTPWKGKLVKGAYTVILELPGYKPARVPIEVTKAGQDFAVPLEAEARPGTIEVTAAGGDEGATGATVQIDGQPSGTIPMRASVPAGRHGVVVRREGYQPFGEWVEIQPGQTRTLSIALKKLAATAARGGLLITVDVADADVLVDGSARGKAPLVVSDLDAGPHLVEARSTAGVSSQTVTVVAGETTKVAITIQKAPQKGALRVLSNVPNADVLIDGELVGQTPVTVPDLAPGKHYVELRAEGYQSGEQEVEVTSGTQKVVKITLEPAPSPSPTPSPSPSPTPPPVAANGRLTVSVPAAPHAEVFLDNAPIGPEPIDREVPPGRHLVTVRTAGFQPWTQVIEVASGQTINLSPALLKAIDDGVVDGGPLPSPSPAAEVKKPLTPAEVAALAEERRLTSFGARVIRPGKFTADLSTGFPHPFEGRLSVGALFSKQLGLDLSVEARILYLQEYELGLSGRVRIIDRMPFAAAAFAQIGGGDGRIGRNTFFTNVGAIASLTFQDKITFSARAWFNFYSDRLCPEEPDPDEARGCALPAGEERMALAKVVGDDDFRSRDGGARLMLSAILEVAYSQTRSFFLIFEGPPFQDERAKYKDAFNSIMLDDDPLTYLRLGLTLKF